MRWLGLLGGPLLALLVFLALPESFRSAAGETEAFSAAGRASAALAVWMATWWLTQAIHVSSTALLPLVFLPLTGVATMKEAAAPYANPLIFLFLGGFVISLSMQRWGLHLRIALGTLAMIGTSPGRVIAGFLAVSAFLSMWVSNTATAVMMLPIATSVIARMTGTQEATDSADPGARNLAAALLLAVAFGCSIGGVATLIGTPPNLFLASYAQAHLGTTLSFVRWFAIGLPMALVLLPLTWIGLRWSFPMPHGWEPHAATLHEGHLGPLGRGEKATLAVFLCAVALWLGQPLLTHVSIGGSRVFARLSDPAIAMLAAMALFAIPLDRKASTFVMRWEDAARLPWGILLLFGGGLSLSAALDRNGVSRFLGAQVEALHGVPPFLLVVAVTLLVLVLTELTSNTATAATFVPILAGIAGGLHLSPWLLVIPATLAASCAFMLPVATPPNAVVFGSGRITMGQMVRAGLLVNVAAAVVIPVITWFVARPLFGG